MGPCSCGTRQPQPAPSPGLGLGFGLASRKGWVRTWPATRLDPRNVTSPQTGFDELLLQPSPLLWAPSPPTPFTPTYVGVLNSTWYGNDFQIKDCSRRLQLFQDPSISHVQMLNNSMHTNYSQNCHDDFHCRSRVETVEMAIKSTLFLLHQTRKYYYGQLRYLFKR